MLFYILFVLLGAIICFQQYIIQNRQQDIARLRNYAYSLADDYINLYKVYHSPRQRLLEKAYRHQLKRQYKKQYYGPFIIAGGISTNNRGFFMHSFNEAQNQRHWLETILGVKSSKFSYKASPGEDEIRIANHKKYLQTAKGFLYISPKLP